MVTSILKSMFDINHMISVKIGKNTARKGIAKLSINVDRIRAENGKKNAAKK